MAGSDHQTREALRALLDELDVACADYTGPERRRDERLSFRRITPPLRVLQSSGNVLQTPAITRNLSPGGVAVLHRPYIHPNCTAVVSLQPLKGKPIGLAGKVIDCRYVGDNFHETCLAFDERINLARFLSAVEQGRADQHLDRVRRRMDGVRILLIDPEGAVQAALAGSFGALGARVHSVAYLGKAIDHLRTEPVDLLFCGPSHDGASGAQIVRLCRDSGYLRPILAMDWPAAELRKARALPGAGVIAEISPDQDDEVLDVIGTLDMKPPESAQNAQKSA